MSDLTVYKKTARTGGGASALDGIDGNSLVDGSLAFVVETDRYLFYEMDADGGAAESDPYVIVPDANPGTKNWVLKGIGVKQNCAFKEVTIASGVLTLTGPGNYKVDTEGDAATDDVTSVAGLAEGECAELIPANDGRTVVIKNNASIKLAGIDFTMDSQYDAIEIKGLGGGVVRERFRFGGD